MTKSTVFILAMFAIQECAQAQDTYYLGRETKTWLTNEEGIQLDYQNLSAKAIVTISGDNEHKAVTFTEINTNVRNGASLLRMEPELVSQYEQVNRLLIANNPCQIKLSTTEGINISFAERSIRAFTWPEAESEAVKFVKGPRDVSRLNLFPAFWLLQEAPVILDVDEDIFVGDVRAISFRKKESPKRTSSDSRASEVMCVDRLGDIAILESNIAKTPRDGFLVTWHVRIEFNVAEQRIVSAEESRFVRLAMAGSKDIQTTREVVSLKLIDEESP